MGIEARPSPTFCPILFMHILRHVAYIYEHIWTFGQLEISLPDSAIATSQPKLMHRFGHTDVQSSHTHTSPLPNDHLAVPSDVGTCAP